MRQILVVLLITLAGRLSLCCQTPAQTSLPPSPQSARQALIEMFVSKDASDFAKHLPENARRALIHKGETPETSIVLRISTVGRQMVAQGEHIETFDVGPNLLVSVQNGGQGRVEVAVERDSLIGEEDEIELSVHVYRDGQPESLPVVPRLIFTLKQEKEIWRLSEITLAAHIPLTDPDCVRNKTQQTNQPHKCARPFSPPLRTAAQPSIPISAIPAHSRICLREIRQEMLLERLEKAKPISIPGKTLRKRTDIASHSPAAMETRHLSIASLPRPLTRTPA